MMIDPQTPEMTSAVRTTAVMNGSMSLSEIGRDSKEGTPQRVV